MTILVNILRGVAIGLANIIPGVSGGTMALVLGIYERLIRAIRNIGPSTITSLFKGRRALVEETRRIDLVFLGALGAGALLAIVATARLLTWLLEKHHDPTYGFFFGLVLASVLVPYKLIRRKGLGAVLAALLAAAAVVGLTLAMSGEQRLESAQKKAAVRAAAVAPAPGAAANHAAPAPRKVPEDAASLAFLLLAGAVAISAMILPGISGSFMLLLMGVYFDILACITGRQLVPLGVFAVGCLLGLLLFTRLLNFLLERWHDITMAFLLGLVVGSLWAIWPFKSYGLAAGQRVDMDNVLPVGFGLNEIFTVLAALVGMAIVSAFLWLERRQGQAAATSAEAAGQAGLTAGPPVR